MMVGLGTDLQSLSAGAALLEKKWRTTNVNYFISNINRHYT
jgi:hypothetical protein